MDFDRFFRCLFRIVWLILVELTKCLLMMKMDFHIVYGDLLLEHAILSQTITICFMVSSGFQIPVLHHGTIFYGASWCFFYKGDSLGFAGAPSEAKVSRLASHARELCHRPQCALCPILLRGAEVEESYLYGQWFCRMVWTVWTKTYQAQKSPMWDIEFVLAIFFFNLVSNIFEQTIVTLHLKNGLFIRFCRVVGLSIPLPLRIRYTWQAHACTKRSFACYEQVTVERCWRWLPLGGFVFQWL